MAVTNFVWDELSDNVMFETDENDYPTAVYTHLPGRFGELLSQERNGTSSYFHFDGNDSTRTLTDENQNITDTFVYSAYGEEVARTGATTNPFGYKGAVGYYTNPETEDIYVRARTYQPVSGRWLSMDPLRFVDGPNLYRAYFVPGGMDPSGLEYREIIKTKTLAEIAADTKSDWLGYTNAKLGYRGKDIIFEITYPGCNNCYCATIDEAKEFLMLVTTVVPKGGRNVRGGYTMDGYFDILAHEGRRRQIKKMAYDAFLEPASKKGWHALRCGKVCSKIPGVAKILLENYLDVLRFSAIADQKTYDKTEQAGVSTENLPENQKPPVVCGEDDLGAFWCFDGIENIYKVKKPGEATLPACPTSDCFR